MTFRYPIEIARELVAVMMGFSKQAMEVHGVGLVSKPPYPPGNSLLFTRPASIRKAPRTQSLTHIYRSKNSST